MADTGVKSDPTYKLYDREPEDLSEAVFQALGAASSCWDNLLGAGVFESERARDIGIDLMTYINDNYEKKEAPSA